jgi:cation/acetate symporter
MNKIFWLLLTLLVCLPTLALAAGSVDGGTKQPINWSAIGMFVGFVSLTLGITYWASKRTRVCCSGAVS